MVTIPPANRRGCFVFIAGCTASACSVAESVPGPTSTRIDSAGVTIVTNTAPVLAPGAMWRLGDRPDVVIDDVTYGVDWTPLDPVNAWFASTGDIVVADGNQSGWNAFLVYGPSGERRRKISRQGSGPGEFGQLWSAWLHTGDSIAGFDMMDQSIAVFSLNGDLGREVRMPPLRPDPAERTRRRPLLAAHPLGIFADGTVLHTSMGLLDIGEPGFKWYRRTLVRVGSEGVVRDTVGPGLGFQRWWDGESAHMAMYTPSAEYLVFGTTVLMATGEAFEYFELAADGRLERIVRRTYERPRVTARDQAQARQWYTDLIGGGTADHPAPPAERLKREMDQWGYADRKSAISEVRVDDQGHVWVEEFRFAEITEALPDPEPSTWSVFQPDGVWLGDVTVPARFVLLDVSAARVLGLHIDSLGVRSIEVWPLVGRGG